MLDALIKLVSFQVLGEALVYLLAIPLPGPVAGMLLLLMYLMWRRGDARLAQSAEGLLQHMPLLFIPSAVGITLHLQRLRSEWLAIAVALMVSTLAAIVVTAGVACRFRHDK